MDPNSGRNPGLEKLQLFSLVSSMIRTVNEMGLGNVLFIFNARLYLTYWLLTDTRSFDYDTHTIDHEREFIDSLDKLFILFCMLSKQDSYDTIASISRGHFGMYHDMTKEKPPFQPYCYYTQDEQIKDSIENKVVSSYLYSIGDRKKNGSARSESTITDRFASVKKTLQRAIIRLDGKDTSDDIVL